MPRQPALGESPAFSAPFIVLQLFLHGHQLDNGGLQRAEAAAVEKLMPIAMGLARMLTHEHSVRGGNPDGEGGCANSQELEPVGPQLRRNSLKLTEATKQSKRSWASTMPVCLPSSAMCKGGGGGGGGTVNNPPTRNDRRECASRQAGPLPSL